jgi:hypothetical protein
MAKGKKELKSGQSLGRKADSNRSVAASDLAQRNRKGTGKPVSKHATITQSQANSAVRSYLSKKY